ncbi:hypothetical protein GCM10027521_60070 [Amycolatopsis cihanbeyliensis]
MAPGHRGLPGRTGRVPHRALRRGEDPRKAAELIRRVAESGSPRGRYGAGRAAGWVPRLKTLLPQRLFEFALRRAYRLPR